MKGLIYKDITIFFKSIDRKMILIAGVFILLLMFNTGVYAGLLASVMFAMSIGLCQRRDGGLEKVPACHAGKCCRRCRQQIYFRRLHAGGQPCRKPPVQPDIQRPFPRLSSHALGRIHGRRRPAPSVLDWDQPTVDLLVRLPFRPGHGASCGISGILFCQIF